MWNKPMRNFGAIGVAALLAAAVSENVIPRTDKLPACEVEAAIAPAIQPTPQLVRERVLQLPEDAGVWHTIVVYPEKSPADAASRRLAAALASDDRLRILTAQTKTHVYAQSDVLWRERLRKHYGDAAPAIIVQRPDGRVCYKASGANLPSDPAELADDIAKAIADCRPRPQPAPQPAPMPSPPPTIPDLSPRPVVNEEPASADDEHQLLWMIAAPMLAGMLGLYQEWKQSNA